MKKAMSVMLVGLAGLGGCAAIPTFGTISKTPLQLPNGELAYRYEGRANFQHQHEVADNMMAEHCKALNGGVAVAIDAQQQIIGASTFARSSANANATVTGPYQQRSVSGYGSSSGTATTIGNRQQSILFKCVKP